MTSINLVFTSVILHVGTFSSSMVFLNLACLSISWQRRCIRSYIVDTSIVKLTVTLSGKTIFRFDTKQYKTMQYNTIKYNKIQILLSTPHGGFSETIIMIKIIKKNSRLTDKQLLKNYLHIKFMTLKIDLKGRLSFFVLK